MPLIPSSSSSNTSSLDIDLDALFDGVIEPSDQAYVDAFLDQTDFDLTQITITTRENVPIEGTSKPNVVATHHEVRYKDDLIWRIEIASHYEQHRHVNFSSSCKRMGDRLGIFIAGSKKGRLGRLKTSGDERFFDIATLIRASAAAYQMRAAEQEISTQYEILNSCSVESEDVTLNDPGRPLADVFSDTKHVKKTEKAAEKETGAKVEKERVKVVRESESESESGARTGAPEKVTAGTQKANTEETKEDGGEETNEDRVETEEDEEETEEDGEETEEESEGDNESSYEYMIAVVEAGNQDDMKSLKSKLRRCGSDTSSIKSSTWSIASFSSKSKRRSENKLAKLEEGSVKQEKSGNRKSKSDTGSIRSAAKSTTSNGSKGKSRSEEKETRRQRREEEKVQKTSSSHKKQTDTLSVSLSKKSDRRKKDSDQSSVRSSKKSDKNHKKDSDNSSIINSSARSVASNGAKKECRTQQEETTSQQKDDQDLKKLVIRRHGSGNSSLRSSTKSISSTGSKSKRRAQHKETIKQMGKKYREAPSLLQCESDASSTVKSAAPNAVLSSSAPVQNIRMPQKHGSSSLLYGIREKNSLASASWRSEDESYTVNASDADKYSLHKSGSVESESLKSGTGTYYSSVDSVIRNGYDDYRETMDGVRDWQGEESVIREEYYDEDERTETTGGSALTGRFTSDASSYTSTSTFSVGIFTGTRSALPVSNEKEEIPKGHLGFWDIMGIFG